MVYLTKDTQNRQSFLPNIWLKLVGHISDWVFVAPIDIGSTLLVDMQPYGCFIFILFLTAVTLPTPKLSIALQLVSCNF